MLSTILLTVFLFTSSGPYEGLTERMFVSVVLIWIEVTGLRLRSISSHRHPNKKDLSFRFHRTDSTGSLRGDHGKAGTPCMWPY